METSYIGTSSGNDLSHFGIHGQKWGLRRFQNEDGSLTAEGKLRYGTVENLNKVKAARAEAEVSKINKKKDRKAAAIDRKIERDAAREERKELKKEVKIANKEMEKQRKRELIAESKRKRPSDMTDEELRKATERLRAEKAYDELAHPKNNQKNQQSQQTKKEATGLVKKMASDILVPVATQQAKKVLESYVSKKIEDKWGVELGLVDADAKAKKAEQKMFDHAKDMNNYYKNMLDMERNKYNYTHNTWEKEWENKYGNKKNQNNNSNKDMSNNEIMDELKDFIREELNK